MGKTGIFAIVLVVLGLGLWVATNKSSDDGTISTTANSAHNEKGEEMPQEHESYKKKLQELVDMIDAHPQSAKLYAERANIFVLMSEPTQALADIETAVDLDNTNPEFLTNRAQLYKTFGRFNDALADLDKAVLLQPDLVAAYFNRGALNFTMENLDAAIKDFTTCITLAPDMAPPYFNRAFTYEKKKMVSKAVPDLQKFLELSDNEEWEHLAKTKLEEWDKVQYKTIVDETGTSIPVGKMNQDQK